MKKYITLAIQVNIAVLLLMILVSMGIPFIVTPIIYLLPAKSLLENKNLIEIVSTCVGLIMGYLVQYFAFKRTYKNAKSVNNDLDLKKTVIYTISISFIVYIILAVFSSLPRAPLDISKNIVGFIFSGLAYYLAGKKIEKNNDSSIDSSIQNSTT